MELKDVEELNLGAGTEKGAVKRHNPGFSRNVHPFIVRSLRVVPADLPAAGVEASSLRLRCTAAVPQCRWIGAWRAGVPWAEEGGSDSCVVGILPLGGD